MKKALKVMLLLTMVLGIVIVSKGAFAKADSVYMWQDQEAFFDVDNDGKLDSIFLTCTPEYNKNDLPVKDEVVIYINGDAMLEEHLDIEGAEGGYNPMEFAVMDVIDSKLNGNSKLFLISFLNGNDFVTYVRAYYYKNGKFTLAFEDEDTIIGANFGALQNKKNVLRTEKSIQLSAWGWTSFQCDFKVDNGKVTEIKPKNNVYVSKTDEVFFASKKIKCTTKAGGKKVAFTIKKGDSFQILKIKFNDKKAYNKFSAYVEMEGGKKGWINVKPSTGVLVSNGLFAG